VIRGGERGSAVVEFALVVPLLLLVALALVQVTVVGRDRIVLQHSARAGAREASVNPDDGAVRAVAVDAAEGLDPAALDVVLTRPEAFGGPVVVRVEYDVPLGMPLAGWILPSGVHLVAEVTMRQEFG
jgi:hypothetical protein